MLTKLLKHHFKDIAKIIIPINLFALGLSLLFSLIGHIPAVHDSNSLLLGGILTIGFLFYVLTLLLLVFGTFFYTIVYYYRDMYSDQGYLTHTLPVSENQHLCSHTLLSLFWCIVSTAGALLSVLILCCLTTGVSKTFSGLSDFISELLTSMEKVLHQPAWLLILFFILLTLSSLLSTYLQFCFSLAIGQLAQKNRIACSAAAFAVIYIVRQLLAVIGVWLFALKASALELSTNDEAAFQEVFSPLFSMSLLLTVLFCVLFYLGTLYINKKKLNLA